MTIAKLCLGLFVVLYLVPIAISAARYQWDGTAAAWQSADRSSVGLLPVPTVDSPAIVRIFAAQTVRWRGIFATHSWIVIKPQGARGYTRYDYTAWGDPIRMNGFAPDGRWFGRVPAIVFAADGSFAEALIPPMQAAIRDYAWRKQGNYRAWPGPNSNTFVAAVMDAVPAIRTALPPTAIGKDYPYDGRWVRWAPSGTGVQITLGGYAGLTLAWVEGIEVNILGGVAGFDLRRPAIKLPGLGRIGMPGPDGPGTMALDVAAAH
jgi:hypothetical protein